MVCLVLAVVMLLSVSLTGCGSKSSSSGQKVLKIGVDGPFTGPGAEVGTEFKDSIQMAFQNINYQVGNYKIQLDWIDDQSDAEKGAQAYEDAIVRDGIDCGFMDWNSWVSVSEMEVAAKYKIPHFFSYGATETVNQKYQSDPGKYFYWAGKAWPEPEKLTNAYVQAVNDAVQNGTWKPNNKNIVIYGVDNDWGRSFAAAVTQQFQDTGWKVVDTEWLQLGQTEFTPVLKKIKSLDPALVIGSMSDPTAVSSFIKQSQEIQLPSLIVSDGLGWIGNWYTLTGNASNYVIDSIPQFTSPKAKQFESDFKAKYGFEPGAITSGMTYDYANFLIKILNRCYQKYNGVINKQNLAEIAKDELETGKLDYADGIIMRDYQYTPQTFPDPVVDAQHYIFPAVQYFNGQGMVIWPDYMKQQDIKIPAYAK
jgi:branched-chain amino acid transport system substrate-binding protein